MIYKFRVILDAEEDIFRDIEIDGDNNFEELHNVITQSFGFEGNEMASFYISDEEWNQGEEIALFDMSDGISNVLLMSQTYVDSLVSESQPRLIYVYDFLSMWTFFVELAEIDEAIPGKTYPNVLYSHGILPDAPPEKQFNADPIENPFVDTEDYDDLDFEENWN